MNKNRLECLPEEILQYIYSIAYRCDNCGTTAEKPFTYKLIDTKNKKIFCWFCI